MRLAGRRRASWSLRHSLESARRHYVPRRGGLIEVIDLGPEDGEPIVAIGGLAGGPSLLAPLARRLARDHRVLLCGLRGDRHPLASGRARSLGELADDLDETASRLGLECPAALGVSLGGAVALEWALRSPGRLGSLTVMGTEARFANVFAARIARRALERFPLPDNSPFLNQFFNLLYGCRPEPGPVLDYLIERCWATDQAEMAHRLALLESFDVSDDLWRIRVPTLVVAGTRDVIVKPRNQKALADALPEGSFATVEGAGHIGFLTHPVECARLVHDHLAALKTS